MSISVTFDHSHGGFTTCPACKAILAEKEWQSAAIGLREEFHLQYGLVGYKPR